MGTASLLAEELDRKTDFDLVKFHNTDDDENGPSLELDKWLRQFELFVNFIEEINDCFGLILAITLLHAFVEASDSLFPIVKQFCQSKSFKFIYYFYFFGFVLYLIPSADLLDHILSASTQGMLFFAVYYYCKCLVKQLGYALYILKFLKMRNLNKSFLKIDLYLYALHNIQLKLI